MEFILFGVVVSALNMAAFEAGTSVYETMSAKQFEGEIEIYEGEVQAGTDSETPEAQNGNNSNIANSKSIQDRYEVKL